MPFRPAFGLYARSVSLVDIRHAQQLLRIQQRVRLEFPLPGE